jgi:cytochrome P450
MLFNGIKSIHMSYVFRHLPLAKYFVGFLVDKKSIPPVHARQEFVAWVSSQVQKRVERDTQRPDFMSHILANNGEKGYRMSKGELDSNASLFLNAGSETTATLMSGATFALLKNPDTLEKLKNEVRGMWNEYHDINLSEVNKAPYLSAVISEALRYFPPVPAGFNRRIGPGGEFVSGHYLPEGTSTTISQYAAYHSEMNFKDPDKFIPERWHVSLVGTTFKVP